MKTSHTNAPNAASSSTKFSWKWYLADLAKVKKNGHTVFSCFSCGGGSSMGYKLAGFDVIGNVELDEKMMAAYTANLNPRYPFRMDVREFLKIPNEQLPQELFSLDILDGSPPCSVFSMAGDRETAWGTEKAFREGQKKQRLDDLFFVFIEIVKKLSPKIVIAENVEGLLRGNAKGFVNEILKAFAEAGYETQLFLLNSACMGIPQQRKRCFFIARKKALQLPPLQLSFNDDDIKAVQTFPQDYDFKGNPVQYVCGMSVPPVMTANLATAIYEQWLATED